MKTVLVVTFRGDATAAMVADAVRDRGLADVVEFDLADFPLSMELSASGPPWSGHLRTAAAEVQLDEVVGVLYRRPTQYRFPAAMSVGNRRFAAAEAKGRARRVAVRTGLPVAQPSGPGI